MNAIRPLRYFPLNADKDGLARIEDTVVVIEKYLGAFTRPERDDVVGGCLHKYLASRSAYRNLPGTPTPKTLKETREQLEKFIKTAKVLIDAADDLWKNEYLGSPLLTAYDFDFELFARHDDVSDRNFRSNLVEDGLISVPNRCALASQVEIVEAILESLPKKGRWTNEIKPEHDLIGFLAKYYKNKTCEDPGPGYGIVKLANDPEIYDGNFFHLVKDVWKKLEIQNVGQTDAALGQLIKRVLKDIEIF